VTEERPDDWAVLATTPDDPGDRRNFRVRLGETRSREYASEEFRPVLVLGPQRSYKTSGFAVPAVLEWEGPAVITSVRTDVLEDTIGWRSHCGQVYAFDPAGALANTVYARHRVGWDPLAHCRTWDDSVRMGRALTESGKAAAGLRESDFWFTLAAQLLAPHLFAAAANGYSFDNVVRWIKDGAEDEVRGLLEATGHEGALRAAAAAWSRDERVRSSVYTTAVSALRVFDYESTDILGRSSLDLSQFLESEADTLYICAPPDEQEEYQPLFTGLVRTIVRMAYAKNGSAAAAQTGTGGQAQAYCPLLLLLDEAGNIARLENLDTLATTAAGTRIQLISIFHDLSQMESVYGQYAAKSILNNHSAMMVLPGMRDVATLHFVEALLHGERVANSLESQWAGPRPIRSMQRGEGLLVYENLRPIVIRLRSKFSTPRLRSRAEMQIAGVFGWSGR
jgi:type IV secretory pathway TraG/TraD family ATPase VirD4